MILVHLCISYLFECHKSDDKNYTIKLSLGSKLINPKKLVLFEHGTQHKPYFFGVKLYLISHGWLCNLWRLIIPNHTPIYISSIGALAPTLNFPKRNQSKRICSKPNNFLFYLFYFFVFDNLNSIMLTFLHLNINFQKLILQKDNNMRLTNDNHTFFGILNHSHFYLWLIRCIVWRIIF